MKLYIYLVIFLFTITLNAQSGNKDYSDTPRPNNGPNIVFILLDDLGYGDLGNFWQNQRSGTKKMSTPLIDKMANEGAMLTHHYVGAPVCAPARGTLLEGLTQGHASIRANQADKAAANRLTLAQMLATSGYRTMHVGKSGTAGPRGSALEAHPLKRGFDQFYGLLYHNQGHIHYPKNGTTSKESYFTDGYTNILEGTDLTYTTDVFTAKSKQWIVDHEAARPSQPFFLYLAYDVPHTALEVPTQAYPANKGLNGGLQWTSKDSPTPWVNTASGTADSYIHPDYASQSWTTDEKKFATMIRRVDSCVEDIIQLLKDLNIDNETMIVFSSDNGPHSIDDIGESFQSYANFNGIKRDMWEGGIRVPTIVRYPGVVPPNSQVTFPSGHWDWYATFAELAGVSVPIFTDGTSILPSLKQDNANQKDKGYLYHEFFRHTGKTTPNYTDFEPSKRGRARNHMQVIRMGDYKGVRYDIQDHSDPFEIYDVVNDGRESTNLASSMPQLQQKMLDKVLQARIKDASVPRPYDDELIPSVTAQNLTNGLVKSTFSGAYDWVPNFELLSPTSEAISTNIDVTGNGLTENFGVALDGFIEVPTDGAYTFYLTSASKCHVMIHDIHLLDNDFEFVTTELSSSLQLKAGKHPIKIYYQQNENITPDVDLKISGPGISKTSISDGMLFADGTSLSTEANKLTRPSVFIYPNPVQDHLKFSIASHTETAYTINIFTISGQKVYTAKKDIVKGEKMIEVPVSKLNSGFYFLSIKSGKNQTSVEKFMKL
ncbi:sulfatase-like hydrolase/transferase [Flavivirga amylovorans]|uniref:Sulfatase-like hydrolase/transferase n=1 Tax=Flavivirga amylovorans TaxID=870486 RepID=A0ABT8WWZ3_9FLAO|nr:sulfatase-like hydrolase/transferase [Flavivirga amylovorans]MDO5986209.1 sulfatase-like hydrolase/transferase [Flavivirga amylovorans]